MTAAALADTPLAAEDGDGARVLVVDDDAATRDFVHEALAARGFAVATASSTVEAIARMDATPYDVVLADVNLGGPSGLDLCTALGARHPDVPVIVMTGFGSLDTAVGALRAGAYDFVTKPLELDALAVAIARAVERRTLCAEVRRLRQVVDHAAGFGELVGSSPAMHEVHDLVSRLAASESPVLVTGESGTGKELVARAIHRLSRRSGGPFVAVDCAAIPEALLESELFGHARGAFTDARGPRTGLFQRAHGGTLFFDELGELPLLLQPKLLRALQERRVRPVGADTEVACDVRVVAATNRDLEAMVEAGQFRADLWYRVAVVHVELPPLRARGADVLALAQHFLQDVAARDQRPVLGLTPEAAERLLAYPWPGNVRELRNCMERAVALARYDHVTLDDLPAKMRDWRPSHVVVASDDPSELVPLEEVERRYVLRVLATVGGNKTLAAQALGLDRRTLYRKLERWGVS